MNRTCFTIILLLLFNIATFSQQRDTTINKKGVVPFVEKVYLHLDRTFYFQGDDIWFKAYLVNGVTNTLANSSTVLYVDLFSQRSQLIRQIIVHLQNGVGHGDFELDDSIAPGKYHIRAYTQWIRNFGNRFVFDREIEVSGSKPSLIPALAEGTILPDVQFFAEGGQPTEGVDNVIAFKATNHDGKGCALSGKIISSQGDTVCQFQTSHLGMGKFVLKSQPNVSYTALCESTGGQPFKVNLPKTRQQSVSLHVEVSDSANLVLTINTNPASLDLWNGKDFLLEGKSFGIICLSKKISIQAGSTKIRIPKAMYPVGLTCFTLYDWEKHPLSERLVFVVPNQQLSVSVSTDKSIYQPRDSVLLNIKVVDHLKRPVKANLSLSVTDASFVPDATSNIASYLMLESEVRGTIEQPNSYFDLTNKLRYQQLDLLLLTQGWRNYTWRQFPDSSFQIKYRAEKGFTLTGKVVSFLLEKPVNNDKVRLLVPGAIGDSVRYTKTDKDGKFVFEGIDFDGFNRIRVNSASGIISMDSVFMAPLSFPRYKIVPVADTATKRAVAVFAIRREILKKYHLTDTIVLPDVEIKTKRKIDLEDMQLVSHSYEAGPPDYDFKIVPADWPKYKNMAEYLAKHIPGAKMSGKNHVMMTDRKEKFPLLYLDKSFCEVTKIADPCIIPGTPLPPGIEEFILYVWKKDPGADELFYSFSMDQIDRIIVSMNMDLDRSVRCSGLIFRLAMNGIHYKFKDGWCVSVYTTPKALTTFGMNYFFTGQTGYYQAREFYSPKYATAKQDFQKPDMRKTIYWNPTIETNRNGEASVKFFNADFGTTIRANVEGLSVSGVPVVGKSGYEVK